MKSFEKAVRTLAVTAALTGSTASVASAEMAQPVSPSQARATKLAGKITKELYDTKDYPKGVSVPGLLNGSVEVDIKTVSGVRKVGYKNPVILVESHSSSKTDKNAKLLDGSWIGIPATDANGRIYITPTQIHLGNQNGETQSLHLKNRHNTVLEGAGVYTTSVANGSDELYGFDIQDGDFPKVHIEADGMR